MRFTPPEHALGNQLVLDSRFLFDFSTFSLVRARTSSYKFKQVSSRFPDGHPCNRSLTRSLSFRVDEGQRPRSKTKLSFHLLFLFCVSPGASPAGKGMHRGDELGMRVVKVNYTCGTNEVQSTTWKAAGGSNLRDRKGSTSNDNRLKT